MWNNRQGSRLPDNFSEDRVTSSLFCVLSLMTSVISPFYSKLSSCKQNYVWLAQELWATTVQIFSVYHFKYNKSNYDSSGLQTKDLPFSHCVIKSMRMLRQLHQPIRYDVCMRACLFVWVCVSVCQCIIMQCKLFATERLFVNPIMFSKLEKKLLTQN